VEELAGKGVRCQATLEIRAILKRLFFVMPDLVPGPTTQIADSCYLPVGPALYLVRKADDESVAVRHFHFRQCLGIHRVVLAGELVERQNVSSEGVDFVVGK